TRAEEYAALRSFGAKTNPHGVVAKSLEEVLAFHAKWVKEREKLPYEIDGVVISVNDNRVLREAGIIGKAPRGGIAYKFSPREATTVVESIKVQVGRTGALTPVAVLRPVNVGGVTITHATLHNFDQIARLGVKIGDTVIVSRAGDVIPRIMKALPDLRTGKERTFKTPTKCPVDGSPLTKDGVIVRCANPRCAAQHRESLYHFASRAGFDIRGLGVKIIDKFLDEGLIGDAADIFTLQKGDIAALPRFGEKSAENIIAEVEEKKRVTLARFLFSVGILHVGEETAIDLARHFPALSVGEVIKRYPRLAREGLEEIPDIGPKISESIVRWFHEPRNVALLEKLDAAGVKILTEKLKTKNSKLKGLTFVLTGTLASLSRNEAKEKIRALGGEVAESVSKKTSYVITGAEPGSKADKARKLGIKTLGEAEFLKMIQ
ncbi:MAG: NAD-dependent DNA ligase LigA, partial [Candidatus Jorgensenbacteria bacterium]|nr:NAD-dependent DNA ligase LigA [Candidatus Jorgensenbacteria bacterium]